MTIEKPLKILYIEDDPEAFIFLKTILERKIQKNIEIMWSHTGKEALKILRRQQMDLIFLDFSLPDMDGIKIIEKIREEGIFAPIVMITGRGGEEIAAEAFKKGVIDYMVKNYENINELERCLHSYIEFAFLMSNGKNYFKKIGQLSKKRDSLLILAGMLKNAVNGIKKTQLLYKSNLNSETIKKYIWYTIKNEYLQWRREGKEGIFITTPKGIKLLEKISDVVELLA